MNSSVLRQTLARSVFRTPTNSAARRYASNEAAQKKAQEALSSAQENATKVLDGVKKLLEPVGQKFGQLFGCTLHFNILLFTWRVPRL
jgi:F-type H+-transporting ATPase subunit g